MVLDSGEETAEDGRESEGDGWDEDYAKDGPENDGVTLPEPKLSDEGEWGLACVVEELAR